MSSNGTRTLARQARESRSSLGIGSNRAAIAAQLSTIQSGFSPVNSASVAVLRTAITRAPAALAERMPAATSSTTRQSAGEKPSAAAPLRYGSGSGLLLMISLEVTRVGG